MELQLKEELVKLQVFLPLAKRLREVFDKIKDSQNGSSEKLLKKKFVVP